MQPALSGIPETMLLTLYNRASESARTDACLHDPEAQRIMSLIDYDFKRSFGAAEPSHAIRSRMFDRYLREFLATNPDGVIVNIGEGLETQRFRLNTSQALWFSVDVPEAISVRQRFITPDDRHRHVACSVFDDAWMDQIPKDRAVYLTAQGVLMFFDEQQVKQHLMRLSQRFPGMWYAFDVVPHWLLRKSTSKKGLRKTPHYRFPSLGWSINRNEIVPTIKSWLPNAGHIAIDSYMRFPRGFVPRYIFYAFSCSPILNRFTPCVVRVRFGDPNPSIRTTEKETY